MGTMVSDIGSTHANGTHGHSSTPAFRILGPVEVMVAGSPVKLGRPQHRDLLALLLLRANQLTRLDQIVDDMWGDAAPATAIAQVQNMVSAIRAVVSRGPNRLAELEWRRCGYLLRTGPDLLDLTIFEDLVARARAEPDTGVAARLLRAGLDLWRGTPLADVSAAFAVAARTRLDEERTAALEALFDAELARGRHADIIAEATAEVAGNPFRERLVGQLMIGLCRSGRRTEALRVYRAVRRALADEHGLEPRAALRELERRILRDDPIPNSLL
jgi:DNA-binding SARP family transcriptional activator